LDNVITLEVSDELLVARILEDDPEAQRALLRRYGRLVARVLLDTLGARDDIDDLMQEVFLIAFRDMAKLREPGALKRWMAMIATSRARNLLRSERRKWWLSFRAPSELPEVSAPEQSTGAMRAVYDAMGKMEAELRLAFALRYVSEMTFPELAGALGVSESTAKRRVRRARAIFDELVEDDPRLAAWVGGGSDADA